MTSEIRITSRRGAALLLGTAFSAAALIVLGGVLPAEYNRDPLGLGHLTGIGALWSPEEVKLVSGASVTPPSRSQTRSIRTLEVEIPLGAGGDPGGGDQLEYKVGLRRGDTMLYDWRVDGASVPDDFYSEFHGHTLAQAGKMTVAEYRKESSVTDRGSLAAPFDGIHGWYFLNTSEKPVTVRLRVTGFFELIPPGQAGNEAGIVPR